MLQQSPLYAYIPAKDVARARRFYEEKVRAVIDDPAQSVRPSKRPRGSGSLPRPTSPYVHWADRQAGQRDPTSGTIAVIPGSWRTR